jgi:glycosyltransferase involved in cell wall biosynthesis
LKLRVACITAGLYFDPKHLQSQARFNSISPAAEGVVFGVVYSPDFVGVRMGSFELRAPLLPARLGGYGLRIGIERAFTYCRFVIGSLRKDKENGAGYDVIVATDPFKSGLLALVGSRLLNVPFAVELNGNYFAAMDLGEPWYARIKARAVRAIIPFVLKRAAAIKLLYEQQLEAAPGFEHKTVVFHNLTPLDPFRPEPSAEKYVLLLGHPWHLKGVDLLIRAFRSLADRFPDVHLRIVGYSPDSARFEELAGGHPRIHLNPAGVEHADAIKLINRCSVLVLPSRTEGMGRVLLEAMAAAKPTIGARVDGIPRVIRHDVNGLLFDAGDAEDLARQLCRVLGDPALSARLAEAAHKDVHERLSPKAYAEAYTEFLRTASKGEKR